MLVAYVSPMMISKRSLSLSKTYVVLSSFLSILGIAFGNSGSLIGQIGRNATDTTPEVSAGSLLSLISVPMLVFGTIMFMTPVLLLYVYDKNNGVLEYFLSLGLDQGDVFRCYLKAALLLCTIMVGAEIAINTLVGLAVGSSLYLLAEIAVLTPVIAYPVVAFVVVIMMAFSSLQKQRVGSNQPLGIAIGVFLVMPTYILPFIFPGFAFYVDVLIAVVTIILAMSMFALSSRLIRREKLLP